MIVKLCSEFKMEFTDAMDKKDRKKFKEIVDPYIMRYMMRSKN